MVKLELLHPSVHYVTKEPLPRDTTAPELVRSRSAVQCGMPELTRRRSSDPARNVGTSITAMSMSARSRFAPALWLTLTSGAGSAAFIHRRTMGARPKTRLERSSRHGPISKSLRKNIFRNGRSPTSKSIGGSAPGPRGNMPCGTRAASYRHSGRAVWRGASAAHPSTSNAPHFTFTPPT